MGVLVQANHGRRERLRIEGVPVGEELPADVVPEPGPPRPTRGGSIIILAATDAPLLPHQWDRLAVAHRLDHDRLLQIMARYRPRPAR